MVAAQSGKRTIGSNREVNIDQTFVTAKFRRRKQVSFKE
jgi:hypothetical protein